MRAKDLDPTNTTYGLCSTELAVLTSPSTCTMRFGPTNTNMAVFRSPLTPRGFGPQAGLDLGFFIGLLGCTACVIVQLFFPVHAQILRCGTAWALSLSLPLRLRLSLLFTSACFPLPLPLLPSSSR